MSERPPGSVTGIFGLFFREAGLFWEQAWKWAEERSAADQADYDKDLERRRTEAVAKLLEQARLAKEAGIDVDSLLLQLREEPKRLKQ